MIETRLLLNKNTYENFTGHLFNIARFRWWLKRAHAAATGLIFALSAGAYIGLVYGRHRLIAIA